jgi:hypothetical protein
MKWILKTFSVFIGYKNQYQMYLLSPFEVNFALFLDDASTMFECLTTLSLLLIFCLLFYLL